MRSLPLLSGLLAVTVLVGPVRAQLPSQVLYTAVVSDKSAEVTNTHGNGQYTVVTNQLNQGDLVQVVAAFGDGWLGIKPPPGSFSWINERYVSKLSPNLPLNLAVNAAGFRTVPVIMGSNLNPGVRGQVEGGMVTQGTQVRDLGRARFTDQEGTWVAIESPWTETRYIRADKVAKQDPGRGAPGTLVSMAQPGTTPFPNPGFTGVVSAAAPPAPTPTVAGQLWERALQAERAGRVPEAIQLYSELASQTTGSQHDLAMQGLNRAYWLREAQRNQAPPQVPVPPPQQVVTATPASEVRYTPTSSNSRFIPSGALDQTGQPVRLVAPCGSGQIPGVVPQDTHNYGSSAPWQAAVPGNYPSSGPGRLRRAGRFLENRKTYALESSQGYPLLYVTPYQGIDLEPYLERNVELFGPAIYDGHLRANYMTVVRVQPLP